jgi:hypothetical protein
MMNLTSAPVLINVTFSANTAVGAGGGLGNYTSSPQLINVTFTKNATTNNGGALFNYDGSNPVVRNSILWGDIGVEINNSKASTPSITYSDIKGGYAGLGNIDVNPRFTNLAYYGGSTLMYGLLYNSSAIDAGNPSAATCPATDQRGTVRPLDGNGDGSAICDMGSFEYDVTFSSLNNHIYLPITRK